MGKRSKQSPHRRRAIPAATDRLVLNGPPEGTTRKHVRWFIGAFLLANVLLPLKWYLGQAVGADVDERFAWRMFSSHSMQRTKVELWETIEDDGTLVRRAVPLETIMQPSWAEILYKYHQPALVSAILQNHCRLTNAKSVEFRRTGTWPDGSTVKPLVVRIACDGE